MSFNPSMHGASMSFLGSQMPFIPTPYANETMSEETAARIATLQVKLDQKLGPEYISQRQGPRGGPKLTYAEGWKIINLANEVFGFNGWSSSLVNVTTDFVDRSESGRYSVGVTAVCKKEAVTDGLKRALRNFGNLMGNCLYDKAYTQEVVKMKVPPAKFEKSELHRRPEFSEDIKPQVNQLNASRPPVPQFNPNASTSSSASTSAPVSRQSNAVGARESFISGRPSMPSTRLSVNTTNPNISSTNIGTSAQSTRIPSNENSRSFQPNQQNHQQQQEAQNRRVSFAETSAQGSRDPAPVANTSVQDGVSKLEPEDSFDFGDDESFLAALGMEDGDLGRPIETDADMGPPLDHEESYLPPEGNTDVTAQNTSMNSVPANNIPRADKATRIQRLQEFINATNATNGNPLLTTPPLQQSTPPEQIQNVASSSLTRQATTTMSRTSNPIQPANNQPVVNAQPRSHRPFARPAPSHQIQNQNEDPLSNSGESGTRRPPTTAPSMGGFHFPPGMNPLQSHNGNLQQGQHSGVGIKRSADAMSSGSGGGGGGSTMNHSGAAVSGNGGGGFRGSRPGMGLQQAAPQQQRREPFAPLEVGEGGDIKRIRR
ncbi:hypothetical protein NP233_g5225 [Leucocoprinus birnbaumii]|uniref:Uncharacterized protein n=1 Tax=Leucocoprinus birnbaumii TaxID=56174 RepID=A0AAD5VTP6_9AGAR|nr:hypothetical protein NP233_g5225 [Leucocoprinus birnbaumii]